MARSTLHIQRITIALGLVVLLLAGVRSPTAVASVCNSGGHYIVKWGDTLAVIAHRFGSTYSTLSEAGLGQTEDGVPAIVIHDGNAAAAERIEAIAERIENVAAALQQACETLTP